MTAELNSSCKQAAGSEVFRIFQGRCVHTGILSSREDTELVHGEIKRGTKIICYLKEDQRTLKFESHLPLQRCNG